ncbi:MAG: pknB [Microbacteriaceae bacterium]|jgi:serine/threonine protein kinase|nr:pknB [Microbacteriaceae bacterium]
MADVHVGLDSRLGRRVAIKLLKPSLATDPKFRLLFREEAQKAARMAHPTIVRVFDAGEETSADANGIERQVPYIVMEYVDGRLLKDIIADGPLDPSEAIRITSQVLTALEYSHRALLVHRDIKPGNIMITQNGHVKVMDFGIARAVSDNSATVAETGAILGTAQYFSPEQARGETVDARTDLYSTGVVLFELLTGRPPFRGERAAAVAYQHISEAAVAPSSLNPRVSPALDALVLHSLKKDKFERYQTAAEFRADVEAAESGNVPTRRLPPADFSATLFGVNPSATAGSDAALRQLSLADDDQATRTQARPPVAWIWAGVALMATILIAVMIWVVNLPDEPQALGPNLSVTVPDVVGATYDSGAATLTRLKLVPVELGQPSETVAEGTIISTDPAASTKVSPDQVVRVYVSAGKNPTTVPRLDQMSEEAAKEAIAARNLEYGVTRQEYSTSVPAGAVIESAPASGSSVREGDTVDLVVSNGLVQVPSVVGQPIASANAALGRLELNITPIADGSCTGGGVTSQSLPAGDRPQRSDVSLTYCSG